MNINPILLVGLLVVPSVVYGADDADATNALMAKVYKIVTEPNKLIENSVSPGVTASREKPFITFCLPGIPVERLDFGELATKEQVDACSRFSQVVNSIPQVNGTWMPTSSKTWDVYQRCITDVVLPLNGNLTSEEEAMLKRAERFLREEVEIIDPFTNQAKKEIRPTAAYEAYSRMFTKYSSALRRYNTIQITALTNPTSENVADWTRNGPLYEMEVRNAYGEWGAIGYRDYVMRANGLISSFLSRGPYAAYDRLRYNFSTAARKDFQGQTFYPTFVYPPSVLSPELSEAWTNFTFSESEISAFSQASSKSYGGGVGVNFGLFSFGGSSTWSKGQQSSSCDTKGMKVSFDLVQLPVLRGWWEPWIFSSRGWKGGSTVGNAGSVSSGGDPLTGEMPLIPTSVILARNVVINMDMSSEENRSSFSKMESSASVGWGPFSVRGNYSSSSSSNFHDFEKTGSGVSCRGAQIIGIICEVVPKSPNPDTDRYRFPEGAMFMKNLNGEGDRDDAFLRLAPWLE